jgi:hypothetical protein
MFKVIILNVVQIVNSQNTEPPLPSKYPAENYIPLGLCVLCAKALGGRTEEMYIQGVSTRKVKAITEELCGHSFSASAMQDTRSCGCQQHLEMNPSATV